MFVYRNLDRYSRLEEALLAEAGTVLAEGGAVLTDGETVLAEDVTVQTEGEIVRQGAGLYWQIVLAGGGGYSTIGKTVLACEGLFRRYFEFIIRGKYCSDRGRDFTESRQDCDSSKGIVLHYKAVCGRRWCFKMLK